MDSFRIDSRLFLVMALFGILSTCVILAEAESTTVSMTEDSSTSQDPTTSEANEQETETSVSFQEGDKSTSTVDVSEGPETATSAISPSIAELSSSQLSTEDDDTKTIFTGTSSTDENPTIASVKSIATTTAREETTATKKETVELATTVEDDLLKGPAGSQRQTEATEIGKEQEQFTTVISSTALPESPCQWKDLTPMKMNCTNTLFNMNGSICEQKKGYRKRSLDNSKQYTYFVKVYFSDEADPSQISEMNWTITSDKAYKNGSLGVAKHLQRKWTNDTFVIKLHTDVNGVIILEVPRSMMLNEAKSNLHAGFREVITGSHMTPDDSSSPSSTLPAVLIGHTDTKRLTDTTTSRPNIWEAHLGLFLTVVILISVCIVVSFMCFLCMKWRGRGRDKHPDKQPISMEEAREAPTAVSNPIPDAEMIQDEAPMQERENPAVTPNGGGQHISKADEDNGWVVPLDELSKAEKEKPEVENTRL